MDYECKEPDPNGCIPHYGKCKTTKTENSSWLPWAKGRRGVSYKGVKKELLGMIELLPILIVAMGTHIHMTTCICQNSENSDNVGKFYSM